MRIGLITTLNTNIGDDFIREGICLIIQKVFNTNSLYFVSINKHQPYSVYPVLHPLRLAQKASHLLRHGKAKFQYISTKVLSKLNFTYFDKCDVIVQCGTPVVWSNCYQCEWAEPLWHQVVGRLSRRGTPALNLGAGSCFPWEKQPQQISESNDVSYLKRILGYCRITTARDRLAQHLFRNLGQNCPSIPCPSLLAGKQFIKSKNSRDLFVINYMEKGGHYDWGQDIDPSVWRDVVIKIIDKFSKQHRILFLCHNKKEYELAFKLYPNIPKILPKNSQEYFSVLCRTNVGLFNRLHAAVALAGIGIPSVSVGTDTRMLMIERVGLPYFYVKDATIEKLEEALQYLLMNQEKEEERLLLLREQTENQYLEVIKKTLFL